MNIPTEKIDNNNKKDNEKKNNEQENEEQEEIIDCQNNNDEPIYIMTLELEHEKIVNIKIYYDSDPELLAQTFCNEHQLDYSSKEYLKEKIEELIRKFENKEKDSQIEEVDSEYMISESNNSNKNRNDNYSQRNIKNLDDNINYGNTYNEKKKFNLSQDNENEDINNKKNEIENLNKDNINLGNEKDNELLVKNENYILEEILNSNSFNTHNPNLKENLLFNENNSKRNDNKKSEQEFLNTSNSINKTNNIFQIRSHTDTNRNLVNSSSIKKNLLNKCLSINSRNSGGNIFNKIFHNPTIKRLIPHEEIIPNKIEQQFKTLNLSKNISFSAKKNENTKKYIDNEINYLPSSYRKQLSQSKMERLKKEYQEKYPFKPKINNNYKTDLNFNQRQQFFTRLYKQRHEELKNFVNNYKKEGKKLFSPKIFKNNNFNNSNINVYNKNYLYAKKYERKKQDLYKKYYNKNENKFIQLGKESEKILQKKNNEIFSLIFKELDNDQDNYISPNLIYTKKTPKEVLKIINPLLDELIEDKQTLNEDDFIEAMNKLYDNISNEEKYLLNNIYRRKRGLSSKNYIYKNNIENHQKNKKYLKPIINDKSKKLASIHDKKVEKEYDEYLNTFNILKFNNLNLNKKDAKDLNLNRSDFFQNKSKKKLAKDNTNYIYSICNNTFDSCSMKKI